MNMDMEPSVRRSIQGSGRGVLGRDRERRGGRFALSLAIACVLVAAPAVSQAGKSAEMSKQAGLGAGAAISSMVYAPLKIVYAVGGLIVGGLAWGFSGGDNEVATVVLTPSILGDYVVTPGHLVGERPIEFFGRDPDYAGEFEVPTETAGREPAGSTRTIARRTDAELDTERVW